MTYVFDSSAIIAYLKKEPDAPEVRRLLRAPDESLLHGVNLCEVEYHFRRLGQVETSDRSLARLAERGLDVRLDLDRTFRRTVAQLKVAIPAASLGDCFALALAQRVGGAVVTADRPGFLPARELAVCEVVLIR